MPDRPALPGRLPVGLRRRASIEVEQLVNGHWLGVVAIESPALAERHEASGDSFHNAREAIEWATGVVDFVTAHA